MIWSWQLVYQSDQGFCVLNRRAVEYRAGDEMDDKVEGRFLALVLVQPRFRP